VSLIDPSHKPTFSPHDQARCAADYVLQVLSSVLPFAAEKGLVSENPCRGMKRLYKANRAEKLWTPQDLEKLEPWDGAKRVCITQSTRTRKEERKAELIPLADEYEQRTNSAKLSAKPKSRYQLSLGAGEGNRTLNIQLGKLSFYH
jgi:hypothetical protein